MKWILRFALLWWATAAAAQGVPAEKWLQGMRTALPVALCAEGTAIRTCFSRTQEQCEQGIASAARTCIADMQARIPTSIRSRDQGRKLGGEIGECTTTAYAAANQKAYTPTSACQAARAEAEKLDEQAR
jgi:hypothetical protein